VSRASRWTTCIDHCARKTPPGIPLGDLSENEAKVLDAVMTDDKAVGAGEAMGGARTRP